MKSQKTHKRLLSEKSDDEGVERRIMGTKLILETRKLDSSETWARMKYNKKIKDMRRTEYPQLKGTTYLDYTGTALPSKSLTEAFAKAMQSTLLSNAHSAGLDKPNISQSVVDQTRRDVLRLFNANPEHFDVIFVANATAGMKLVTEAFTGYAEGFEYYYHRNAHTSLVGVRELARSSRCFDSDEEAEEWLGRQDVSGESNADELALFAYPAQSNMNGRRLPLTWPRLLRSNPYRQQVYSLLDIAALVSTSPFSLENYEAAPDFTVFSFYKIFGFPDLGALIVRKPAGVLFKNRRYFGGGTTEMVTCLEDPWFARKEKNLSSRLEDGSLPIRSILALNLAIRTHEKLYGSIRQISLHTSWLADILYDRLVSLKHWNGLSLGVIYKDIASSYGDSKSQGATVVFNIRESDGTWIGSSKVGRVATERGIHIRTGSLCNPAGMARALGLTDNDVQRAFASGFRCGQEYDIRNGIPMGMVRVSLGAMNTLEDVEIFIKFVEECFVEREPGRALTAVKPRQRTTGSQASPVSDTRSRNDTNTQESWTSIPSSEKMPNGRFRDQVKAAMKRVFCSSR